MAKLLSLLTLLSGVSADRQVSFWYAPGSYGGADINQTLDLLKKHENITTNLFVYCGYSIDGNGITIDEKLVKMCSETKLIDRVASLGVHPEMCMDSGRSNVSDYRKFFANGTQNIDAMVAIGKKWGIKGWSMDLEPQVGSPASTKADAALYAKWLSQAKIAFNKEGMRLTVAVAQWATMLNDYKLLAPSVDRILDMETYNADSYKGWLNGDNFGGYYNKLLTAGATKVAPGMGCWNASCGKHTCWTATQESGSPRMNKIAADGVEEVALFRIVQREGAEFMPQDWWWPLLAAYRKGN